MNYKELSNKFLLLDANVLINYSRNQPNYQPFFDELSNNRVSILLDEVVKFEVLRFAKDKKTRDDILNFFDKFEIDFEDNLISKHDELFNTAVDLANIYQSKYNMSGKVSYADFFLSASMACYNKLDNQLYFATENHRDFPITICFERIGVETIDTQGDESSDIHNVGIYKFNIKKFNAYKKELGL